MLHEHNRTAAYCFKLVWFNQHSQYGCWIYLNACHNKDINITCPSTFLSHYVCCCEVVIHWESWSLSAHVCSFITFPHKTLQWYPLHAQSKDPGFSDTTFPLRRPKAAVPRAPNKPADRQEAASSQIYDEIPAYKMYADLPQLPGVQTAHNGSVRSSDSLLPRDPAVAQQ